MAKELELEVVTPARSVLSAKARSVILPGSDGYLGIMVDHAPLVAGLSPGVLRYGDPGAEKQLMAIGGGFVEVADNRVTVLADSAEPAEEIDVERAHRALQRALERLRSISQDIDRERAHRALMRARARLRAAGVSVATTGPHGGGH